MADTNARHQIDAMLATHARLSTEVLVHEVKGAVENGPRLCATGISTGIAVAVMGIYRDPSPTPRNNRFLLHAGEGSTLDADMAKLERELQTARTAGLLELEAHVLVPEAFSFTRRARQPNEPEASSSSPQQQGNANTSSSPDSLVVREWDEDELRNLLDAQKGLRERLDTLTRGGKITWYKYPVCHQTGPHRYTHGMIVFPDETVECGSIGRSGRGTEMMEPRNIDPVKEGREDEDSGLRCC